MLPVLQRQRPDAECRDGKLRRVKAYYTKMIIIKILPNLFGMLHSSYWLQFYLAVNQFLTVVQQLAYHYLQKSLIFLPYSAHGPNKPL